MTDLDADQSKAAFIDPSIRQVVVAGPGSGKTHVVAHLVEHLVMDEGLDPVRGLLVLSFSNAAVHAVQRRMRGRDVPSVAVRTIDSLASMIIRECADDDVEVISFEDRIRRATELLVKENWEDVEDLDHLIVDEVQDVVGVRADFILALLGSMRSDAGATFLGDPAQAIYDFQIAAEGGGTSSSDLVDAIRSDGARDVVLSGQYRAISRDARNAAAIRKLGADEATPNDVEDYWNEVIHSGSVVESWTYLATRGGTVAFLTNTNGQALLVARELRAAGVRVSIQRGAQEQPLAAWIGVVMCSAPGNSISKAMFSEALASTAPSVDVETSWYALKQLAGARGRELDKVVLARRLRERNSHPPELCNPPDDQVVVSTVHKAKGLEFDHIVLVEFASERGLDADEVTRARTGFVAVTRAKDVILRAHGPDDKEIFQAKARPPARPRWIKTGWQPWQTFGFEVRGEDVDHEWQSGVSEDIHDLLRSPFKIGSEARLEPCPELSTLKLPVFRIVTPDGTLGVTTERFGIDLVGRIRTIENKRRGWPSLSGLSVEGVATVVDESLNFRLVPLIAGLADIEWSNDSD